MEEMENEAIRIPQIPGIEVGVLPKASNDNFSTDEAGGEIQEELNYLRSKIDIVENYLDRLETDLALIMTPDFASDETKSVEASCQTSLGQEIRGITTTTRAIEDRLIRIINRVAL